MKRRNFILGLGTAATLSGAASVTSAALSGSTSPGADFRILSAQSLDVRRNPAIENGSEVNGSLDGYANTSDDFVTTEGDIDFGSSDTLNQSQGPNLTVDSEANDGLNMSLATPNDLAATGNTNNSGSGNPYYNSSATPDAGNAPLIVDNLGASDTPVGVQYGYGPDAADAGGDDNVAQLFTFSINGTKISPDPSNPAVEANSVTIPGGESRVVDFDINYSADIESTLRANLSGGFGASGDNLQLLNTVTFGISDV